MNVLHCNCSCPYWGVPHDHIWIVNCECGQEEFACGYCLEAGRITKCLKCADADKERNVRKALEDLFKRDAADPRYVRPEQGLIPIIGKLRNAINPGGVPPGRQK
jgi:hypothetical protein